ncbi:MAG: M17 family peptidase N-terminal domain-containing protein, partial [Cetobacterium sp.]
MFKVVNKVEKIYDLNIGLVFEEQVDICGQISAENSDLINQIMTKKNFLGKKGETLKIDFLEKGKLVSIEFVGFGKEQDFNLDIYREVMFDILSKEKGEILVSSDQELLLNFEVLGEIVSNINYSFDTFKEKKSDKIEVELFISSEEKDISETINLGEATDIARDLVDLPANILNPITLAQKTVELGLKYGFEVEIL